MSRRKQSNPKPLKHDEADEETKKMTQTGQHPSDEKSQQPPEESAQDRESDDSHPRSEGIPGWSADGTSADEEDNPLGSSDPAGGAGGAETTNPQDIAADGSPPLREHETREGSLGPPQKETEPSASPPAPKDGRGASSNKPADFNTQSIKPEPPSSPAPVSAGHENEPPSTAHQHRAAPPHFLGSRFRRRNRSRSRSRSKSGGVSASPEATPSSGQSREEAERALVNQLQLPSDVLYLKQLDINIHGTPSVGWVVCCAIPLPQGSSLGPFQGQLVPPETVKVGDLIVQFTNKKGQQALMNVAGQSGGWLALLRSAGSAADRNTHVYWEGGRIWCEVVADIDIGTELRATFTFQNEEDGEDGEPEEEGGVKEEVTSGEETSISVQHPHQQPAAPGHAALIYGCPFCGVRFSSPRTLQGHLSFYCSKKTSELNVNPATKERDKGNNPIKTPFGEGITVKQEADQTEEGTDTKHSEDEADNSGSFSSQSAPSSQMYKCKHCSYKADKLSSLNRHMRMHNNDKFKAANNLPRPDERDSGVQREKTVKIMKSPVMETFCKECRIQFSSLHTYKCHKEHYCAQRRKKALADPSAFAAMFHSPFCFADAAKVGIPSALQMAALNQGGLILPGAPGEANVPGATAVILTAPMLTANGMANIAISLPAMIMQPIVSGKDVMTSLTSPRAVSSPERLPTHPSTSQPSPIAPRTPLAHFLSPPPSVSKNDYIRSLDDHRKTKDYSPLSFDPHSDNDHPLDLSVSRKEIKSEPKNLDSDPQDIPSFLQPDKDGALDARRVIRPSSQASSPSEIKYKDLMDERDSASSSPSTSRRDDSVDVKHIAPQHFLRSDHLSPGSSQLIPHPSLLMSGAGFLPLPLAISPSSKCTSPSPGSNTISKCSDCNIVFYKHDNYLIHKKHYCSGKRRPSIPQALGVEAPALPLETNTHAVQEGQVATTHKQPSPGMLSPVEPIASKPKLKDLPTAVSPSKHSSEIKYKFYCVPCRIKFSNASILEAHKEYYCPAGKDSEQSVILQTAAADVSADVSPKDEQQQSSPDPPQEEFSCTRCSSIFSSARLLRLHVCDGGFPCPHCDHVSITDNRLTEHLKIHAPTKAYRCTICGYRGNTARGMRMHGKTHIDEGVDFTDENMLEYHEPALVPVVHSPHPGTATDSELLRLKNEPYKRRRSRKAYEKFDYPLPKVDVPQTCPLCGQKFINADFLSSHFKVHEIAASQVMAGLMKCIHCEYVGQDPDDLRGHFEMRHSGNHRNKRRRRSSPGTDDDHPGCSSDSPDEQISNHRRSKFTSQQKHMVISNPNSPIEDKPFRYDHLQATNKGDKLTGQDGCVSHVKSEPVDGEDQNSNASNDRLNHFLQTPDRSPSLTEDTESRSRSRSAMDIPVPVNRNEDQSERPMSPLRFNSQEKEPGEVVKTVHIKTEPSSFESEGLSGSKFHIDSQPDGQSTEQLKRRSEADKKCLSPERETNPLHRIGIKRRQSQQGDELSDRERTCSPHSPPKVTIKSEHHSPKPMSIAPNFLMTFPSTHALSPSSTTSLAKSSPLPFPVFETPPTTTSVFPPHTLAFPYTSPHVGLPYLFLPPHHATMPGPAAVKAVIKEERSGGARYCQNCDISFSKHSTYLAHKKYYCTARPRGEAQPSAKA
ncbi:unnamed protein product [Lymnaea stagnalis]|uniref:Uncharacterized protein n=1 Tax=Lymnaea stagnalis TaxID=6523 RepID=A0AAV2HSN7_LYMST